MIPTFLQLLESAYADATALESPADRVAYCDQVAARDPALAAELRMLLACREDADRILAPASNYMSLLLTSLGDSKREETVEELLLLLTRQGATGPDPSSFLLGGFCFDEIVSVGATGFVFRGRDLRLSRDVAIKVLAPSIARDPARRSLFINEARLAATIRHPNVVTIYHIAEQAEADMVFFVMDWIEGSSLQELLDTVPPNRLQSCRLMERLASGLDAIHEHGVIHRDLKPGNIVVDPTGQPVIVDFGLAMTGETRSADGNLAGTPLYMSPEQLRGEPLTIHSDLFAFTEIACVLLTGQHPYPARSIAELIELVLQQRHSFDPGWNREFRDVLKRGLSEAPENRFRSAGEFALACLSSVRGLSETTSASSPSFFSGRRVWYVVALCSLALLAVAARVSMAPRTSSEGEQPMPSNPVLAENPDGGWIDAEHYRNFLGMEFVRIPAAAGLISDWPPDPEHPELFTGLGWRNNEDEHMLGQRLITRQEYASVMQGEDAAFPQSEDPADGPVTMVSMTDAKRFCVELARRDPDGLKYGIADLNEWTLAVYGLALIRGELTGSEMLDELQRRRKQRGDGSATWNSLYQPILADTLGDYWEWTDTGFRKPTQLEGVVSYAVIPEQPSESWLVAVGGFYESLFLHAHDMHYGMNDHNPKSENLKVHVEEDGETLYFCPTAPNTLGTLRYCYRDLPPILTAQVQTPFHLASTAAAAGIRVRCRRSTDSSLESKDWQEVYQVSGPVFLNQHRETVDLTQVVAGATEVELEYWVRISQEGPAVNYAQIGRTAKGLEGIDVFLFEAVTEAPGDSPRQDTPLPQSYANSRLGFRIQAILPPAKK